MDICRVQGPLLIWYICFKVHTGLSNCLVTSGYTLVIQTANTAPKHSPQANAGSTQKYTTSDCSINNQLKRKTKLKLQKPTAPTP
jgi:hypothetical protein